MLSGISTSIVVVDTVLPVLAILAVVLRLLARRSKSQSLEVDDFLILVALVVVICSSAGYIAGAVVGGVGFHLESLKPQTVVTFFKFIFALQFTYLLAVTLIKLSILLFYKRIFVTPSFAVAIRIMCTVIVAWFITFFFATLCQTIPLSNNWNPHGSAKAPGTTINVYAMYITTAVLEILLDIITLSLPLFVIWTLQMRPTQKWQVSGIFLLGSFVCVASILRLYYLIVHLKPSVEEEEDLTYNLGNIILWSGLEPCVGVICACLPTLGPVLQYRTLQSMIHSLSNFFTLRSRHSQEGQQSLSSFKEPKATRRQVDHKFRPFDSVEDEQYLVTTIQSRGLHDRNTGGFPLQAIKVESSVDASVERG